MSNTLALAAVTSTLRYLLSQALSGAQPGPVGSAKVTTLRPDVAAAQDDLGQPFTGINVYLHQVTPNHAWNLADLPTRRADGQLSRRPLAALDLHYVISCLGDDAALDAQRLLARVILTLASTPVLTRDLIAAAIEEYAQDTETAFLTDADLADQVEAVKLAPADLDVEQMSRLWAMLGTPHQLCVAYTATVVLLEADVSPRVALPVRQRSVSVAPIAPPRIAAVTGEPVVVGTGLRITGSGLAGAVTRVRIAGVALEPAAPVRPDLLEVEVTDDVPAGLHSLQVTHSLVRQGQPERVSARSNRWPVLVRPTVEVVGVVGDTVELSVSPPLRAGQRGQVLCSSVPDGDVLTFDLVVLAPDAAPTDVVALDRADIPDGQWLVRMVVDGAESLLRLDGEVYGQPLLSLP